MKGEDKSPFNLTANLTVGCHRLVAHNNNPVRSVVRRIHNGADLRSPFQNSFDKGFVLPNGHVCSKKKKTEGVACMYSAICRDHNDLLAQRIAS
jgi:hypothetical protein